MGVGGGFLMTVYQKDKGLVTTIDAREAAPAQVTTLQMLTDKRQTN